MTGDVTGNVTGNLTGDVTGDVTGNVTGNLTGDVTGDVTGNLTGDVTGDVTGNLTGDVTGDVTGNVNGNVTGNLTGDVTGDVTGNLTGNVTGNLTGTASSATNLAGGSVGSIPYQTAVGTTAHLAAGTAGQVLKMNSAGTAPQWTSAVLANFSENAFLYNTKTGVALKALNGNESVGLVLAPKGEGALMTAQPDGTATGGNIRGAYAVDLQLHRTAAEQVAAGSAAVVGGGAFNAASGDYSTVDGGVMNTASDMAATVGGGYMGVASGMGSTVSGGMANTASGNNSAIGGGDNGLASGTYATIGGGSTNQATGMGATISGGFQNTATNDYATVVGGSNSNATGPYSTSLGGDINTASGSFSVVGGWYNTAPSFAEIVLGYFASNYTPATGGATNAVGTDRLFSIGNGDNNNTRRNAITILKDATTTIGGSLTINGNGSGTSLTLPTTRGTNGQVLRTNGDGTTTWTAVSSATGDVVNGGNTYGAAMSLGTLDNQSLALKTNSTNRLTISSTGAIAIPAMSTAGVLHNDASGTLSSSLITNADVSATAAIADTKLATIATAGKVSNSATTATNTNTASTIVARDASGNFSAGTITAALTGTASSATNLAGGGPSSLPYQSAIGTTAHLTAGTPGQVLRMNGAGTAPEWSSQALANIEESSFLYGSKTGVRLKPVNAGDNASLVLSPKGSGALMTREPDGTALGGNNRGSHSIDLQLGRADATQVASGISSTISGGIGNTASGESSTVAGGYLNAATATYASIGGGYNSDATGNSATVSGGSYNAASGDGSSVGGGNYNTASGYLATIAGGWGNTAGMDATVSGGASNTASGDNAAIIGGTNNSATAALSSVLGGDLNTASGDYSLAAGRDNVAKSYGETVLGYYATTYATTTGGATTPAATDRLFVIGNGDGQALRRNAVTILKNANTTIGGSLTFNDNGTGTSLTLPTTRGTSGMFLKTNGDGTTAWASGGSGSGDVTNGGNTFAAAMSLGTLDAYGLTLLTNNTSRLTIGSTGAIAIPAMATAGVLHNDASGTLSTSLITNADVSASAAITDTKLATISTAGKVANSATTATSLNTPNTIVLRDATGNFAAGTITSGTWNGTAISSAYIGNLDASKITSGTIDNARINWAAPGAIGSSTPAAGTFTSVSATSVSSTSGLSVTSGSIILKPGGSGGTSGQVLTTNGSGGVSWANGGGPQQGIRFLICVDGYFPSGDVYDGHFIGEILMCAAASTNYIPTNFMECKGQTLSITQYQALYAVIGIQYGGNGTTTFNLPNFTNKAPVGF